MFSNNDSDDDGIENSEDSCPESPLPIWSNQSIESVLNCETCGRTGMDVKIDSQNNTHVVYSGTNQDAPNEREDGYMSFLKYAIHDGQFWNTSYVSLVTETDYENLSEGGNTDGMGPIIDSIVERPLLQLDNNDLPHIVYYTYSGPSDELIRSLRYATYQEIEIGAGYNWQKSTIIEGAAECSGDIIRCNDIAGFELDSNNKPHIVYSGVNVSGDSSNWSYESTLNYAISDDWSSWDTSRIYTAYNDSVSLSHLLLDASMTLDSQGKVNIIALMVSQEFNTQDDESQISFEIIYLKFDGEDIIRSISISSANYDGGDNNYWMRTSLSITVDSEDIIHLGYINSLNQFTYAILEFNDLSHSITTSIIVSAPLQDNDSPFHGFYDLTLVIEPDGTPHALYTSMFGEYSLLPDGETLESLENLEFYLYSFYSVLTDGEWNRLYIGGVVGLPGLAMNANGLTTIIHFSHDFVNWSGVSLLKYSPIDSDDDGDGCMNFEDQFPSDSSEHIDSDGDGVGDNADVFPNDITEIYDTDGDGVGDELDAFPTQITQWADYDGDGFGDNYANSSWDAGFTMPGEYVSLAFRQDACPLLAGTSYLGTSSDGGLVIYGCPDSDGDGYADIIEFVSTGPGQISEKNDGLLGVDLDLLGIILSLTLPLIAITLGWYYSTRKRRSLEHLIEVIETIDDPFDLTAWFDSISTKAILNGEINHAQLELLRTYYRQHHDRLTSVHKPVDSQFPENKQW
ncbi:MAG: hypothetical protein OR994_07515 [Candidatus Poseidoniales archaeon]|nr:hypothetical protein [Candidatus Poseidoniales archaeon]